MLYINARFLTQSISGVQRFAIELSKKLKNKLPETTFLAPHNIENQSLARDLNCTIIGKNTGHLWEQNDLPRFLKSQGNPLLLNLCNTAPLLYKNQIVTIHDAAVWDFPQAYSLKFRTWYRFLLPRIAKNSRAVLTVSNFSKNRIHTVFKTPLEKIHIIPNSVAEAFQAHPKQPKSSRHNNLVLAVSSIDPKKNFNRLLDIFRSDKFNDLLLVIVGKQHKSFGDISNSSSTNNIKFTGYITDAELVELYSKATVFIYPSLYEGFGIPPLEAFACGCPVIASDISVLRETCGDAALFCDPLNDQDISEKLNMLLNNKELKDTIVRKGIQQVKKYSWETSADELFKVIQSHTC